MLSSKIAKDSGMGVLAVDYRTTDSNNPHRFPEAIHDVIDGFEWLKSMGASDLYFYGACVRYSCWTARQVNIGSTLIALDLFAMQAIARVRRKQFRPCSGWSTIDCKA
jgi:hypothetical protein